MHFFNNVGNLSLSDALAEIKYLKSQISLRDENISCLTLQVNQLTRNISDDTYSSHGIAIFDGIIAQDMDSKRNHSQIDCDRFQFHDFLPHEQTSTLFDSNNDVQQVSIDR